MGLQFLLGTANDDHKAVYIEKAAAWLQADPENQVFFLVPNYAKFEREQDILAALKRFEGIKAFSTLQAQVFSFDRLAWYYLQQTGLLTKNTISEAGSSMLLRKVLLDTASELVLYKGEVDKAGFIQRLLDLYGELQVGNLTPDDLLIPGEFTEAKAIDQQLKMKDLHLILTRYQAALAEKQIQTEKPIALLTAYLNGAINSKFQEVPDLSKTLFIATGFQESYAQELQLLATLMNKGQLVMSLLLDKPYVEGIPAPLDLYYDTGKIYYRLRKLAQEQNIKVQLDQRAPTLKNGNSLDQIEGFWRGTQSGSVFHAEAPMGEELQLWQTADPQEEVKAVATELRKLMTTGAYRYKDIQVLTADMDTYGELIPHVFRQYEIPFYLDEQRSLEQHPLTAFLEALLNLEEYHYRLEDILRLLKTELYLPAFMREEQTPETAVRKYRELVDQTENLALKYNFQGFFWTRKEDWTYIDYDYEDEQEQADDQLQQASNLLRRGFREDIQGFLQKLKKAKTGQAAITAFYRFLVTIGVEEQLLYWRDSDVAAGELELARNHEQTWQSLMELMDDYVEIYGEDEFDFTTFRLVFATGLDNSVYGRVPTSIDQVKVNQLSLARQKQAKVTFAIGLDEKTFPQVSNDTGLLTTEERSRLNEQFSDEQFIDDGSNDVIAKSPMIAYKVFTSATERLYLSYSANHDVEQNIGMSPYLTRFKDYLGVKTTVKQPLSVTTTPLEFVGTYRTLITDLNRLQRQAKDQKLLPARDWQLLTDWLQETEQSSLAQQVFASRDHLNVPLPLQPAQARLLYGDSLYSSVSRMESFYQCEYRYFADYGLKLKERDIFGLDSMVTGTFFHDSLDQFLKAVFAKNLTLQELTPEQHEQLINEVMLRIFGEPRFKILESSARMKFLRYRLSKTVKKVTEVLRKQSSKTNMTPIQTEILFGQIAGEKGINGLELPLSTGGKLSVRGKIDRIDYAEAGDNAWLSVVDYKSGNKDFSPVDAYYGLAMQLLTYLDVALMDAAQLVGREDVRPGGAYYMRIQDPILTPDKANEEDLLKEYRFKGLFSQDGELFKELVPEIAPKERSAIFPIQKLANETIKATSKDSFYAEDELQKLFRHNRDLMQGAAEEIVAGHVDLNPYRKDPNDYGCKYCPFRSVCGFDVMLPENNYHEIKKYPRDVIMEKLEEEANDSRTTE